MRPVESLLLLANLLVALLVWVAAVSVVSWQRAAARDSVPERGQTGAERQPISA